MTETAGQALDRAIRAGLPPAMELDERETELLAQACRQADILERLDAHIDRHGVMNERGRLNPAVQEARQGRTALARLLGGLDLPHSRSLTQLRARKAGQASQASHARWSA
jgi:phage terminase small subunit